MRQTHAIGDAVGRGGAVGDFAGGKGGDGGEEVRQSTRDKGAHRVIGTGLIRGIGGRGVVGAAAIEVGIDSGKSRAQG